MGRKLYLPLIVLLLSFLNSVAQTGEIRGKVTEKGGAEIPFASVAAVLNGVQVQAAIADFEGNYSIKPINPGKYDVKATAIGFQPVLTSGVIVSTDKITFVDLALGKGVELKEFEVVEYEVPLIDKGSPQSQKTLTYEEIQALPTRDVNSAAAQSTGVYQKAEGGALNIRGSRSDATAYYIDGIKVTGSPGISQRGTEQITVITGGIPAQYGDATGGIISVTTRGPSNEFGGGVELATSELLDDYGYNLVSANLTGPIFTKRDENGKKVGESVAGFFVAGEYQYDKDPNPSVIPIYRVKQSILDDVYLHPLAASPDGSNFIHRSSYFTLDSFDQQKYRENVDASAFRLNGKFDIRPINNFVITLGGSVEKARDNEYVDHYRIMNFSNNPEKVITKWRAFAKITQRFNSEEKESASSAIKNAFYSVQVDYAYSERLDQSEIHKKNNFDYGYVGKFNSYSTPIYTATFFDRDANGLADSAFLNQTANFDTSYTYQPGTLNPYTSNYTTQYYELTEPFGTAGFQDNINNVQSGGALINGDNRANLNVYGLWSTTGRIPNGWGISNVAQGRLTASGSADIKNHNIIVGLEYEQRTERGYNINSSSLWTLMRQLANQKLNGLDSASLTVSQGVFGVLPATYYNYKGDYTRSTNVDGDTIISSFYENIRKVVGLNNNDTIQTDSYDPSIFNVNLFTPDELLNSGNALINYYGYDYTGSEKTSGNLDLSDFFVNKDENNNFLRKIDAFKPVYLAGYIQDRFTFNDIIFNVGVRVDRFDANQNVLKDKYSLYETFKAGDVDPKGLLSDPSKPIPSNIGSDYVVYVNDADSPTDIVGFRHEDTWYDKNGTVITDLKPLTEQKGSIQPYLTNYEDYTHTRVNTNAFKDYTPQVTVMPRIAFSFPISDEAYFAAHYDVLTQRPQNSNLLRFDPTSYLQWSQGITGNFSNPDLKPEKITEYEINFQQKLSRSSAFSIAAFYKQMRDNIQFINVDFAFPIKYTTYGNVDFGTVKGLTFGYDLRRTSNVRMNLSYTLQFAEGTGSSASSNSGILAQAGQTNLREIKPLDFDQRHTLVAAFDFHYGEGKDYNGPIWFNKQFFSNTGLNLVFHTGSGSPYTRKSNITPEADFTTTANSRSVITGSLNGSRYPWNFRIDAKIDKSFRIITGKNSEGEAKKGLDMNVYLQVLNVLDTKNVTSVYTATGSPSDDGYITSPDAQSVISDQPSPQAYTDLYRLKVDDPGNYDLPRRIRLGLQVNF
jgi:hypothetical protein